MTTMVNKVEQGLTLEVTPRRASRELYARFLLTRAEVDDSDAEIFLNTKQSVLENFSPLELIYTGRYERAIEAVEAFTEDLVMIPEDFLI